MDKINKKVIMGQFIKDKFSEKFRQNDIAKFMNDQITGKLKKKEPIKSIRNNSLANNIPNKLKYFNKKISNISPISNHVNKELKIDEVNIDQSEFIKDSQNIAYNPKCDKYMSNRPKMTDLKRGTV